MPITVSEKTLEKLHHMACALGADTVTYFMELRDRPVYRFTRSTLPKRGKFGMPVFFRVLGEGTFYELKGDDYHEALMYLYRLKEEAHQRAIEQQPVNP